MLTVGQDYADSSSSFKNGGLITSDFKFTSGNETVTAGAGMLNNADALVDGSTTDADVLNATLSSAAVVTPTAIQNIETINLTATVAGSGLDFTNVTGTKTVTLTGTANSQLININTNAAPAIEISNYNKVVTLSAASLAGTTAAGTADSLSVKVSGMTAGGTAAAPIIPGIILDVAAVTAGVDALETLNLESAGTTKNTVNLSLDNVGAAPEGLSKTVITGAADLDLRVTHGLINGQTVDASGHTANLNLIVDRNTALLATTNLSNAKGYDAVTVWDSTAGGDSLVLSGVASGTTVILANAFAAAAASIAVKGASTGTADSLTLVLDHTTDATNIDVNGANTFTIADVESLTIKSEGGTTTGNVIQRLDVTAGSALTVDGATKLDVGLTATSDVSSITVKGAGAHKVAFQAANAYADTKNLTVDASAATGKVTIDMANFQGSGTNNNEKLTITGSAQDDTITTGVTGGQTVVVDAGAGKDTITVAIAANTGSKTTVTTGTDADTLKVDLTGIATPAGITVTDFTVGTGGDVFSTKGHITAVTFDKGGATLDANDVYVVTAGTLAGVSEATVGVGFNGAGKAIVIAINDNTGVAEAYAVDGQAGADTYTLVATFENITTVGMLDSLVAANFAVF